MLLKIIIGLFFLGNMKAFSCPPPFLIVNEEISAAVFDIRYASANNFLGRVVDGYEKPLCFLTHDATEALQEVQKELESRGYSLKIFDCYRPQQAVDHFVRWVKDEKDQKMKSQYYPNEEKSLLIKNGYIASRSGHSRGSTLDLTIVGKDTKVELDMGTPYDYFDKKSNTENADVTESQRANRMLLRDVMHKHGFVNYALEWWHYTLKDEFFPDTYFNFPVK